MKYLLAVLLCSSIAFAADSSKFVIRSSSIGAHLVFSNPEDKKDCFKVIDDYGATVLEVKRNGEVYLEGKKIGKSLKLSKTLSDMQKSYFGHK